MNAVASTTAIRPIEHSLYSVPGIHCAGCIARLETGLGAVPGILAARVNFGARRVAIDHSSGLTVPDIQAAIGRLGFEAQPIRDGEMAQTGSETRVLLKAAGVAGFAAMNIMLLSVSIWSGAQGATRDLFHLISALIAIPAIGYAGQPFFRSAWGAIRHGRTNMDVPISIGVLLVCGLSLFESLTGGPHAYFDGAAMLVFFLLVGRALDSMMRDRARNGVTALLKHNPAGAMVLDGDGAPAWRDSRALAPGMRILVATGERLAADGIVEQGTSSLDLSLLTGESAPRPRGPGDRVQAGTLNLEVPITVRVTAVGDDTTIADVARLMEQAAQSKSHYVRVADRAARLYAPAVHMLAILAFVGWMLMGTGWHHSLLIAAAVLIITCPCALGLAVPAAQIVTAGALMRSGVLIKDGAALERLAEVDTALFDKTGTLTLGRPVPLNLDGLAAPDKPVLFALAMASRHPLSRALVEALEHEPLQPARLTGISEEAGFGIHAFDGGLPVFLGRPSDGVGDGLAAAFSIGDGIPFVIRFSDALRPDARATIDRLRGMDIQSTIISGDRAEAVRPVAARLGIMAAASLAPDAKLAMVHRLENLGAKVLMIGDGLNDGPALAAGHASIAPASASDVGQGAADLLFLGDSLAPVASAVVAARRTMRIVRQNFVLAIAYNAIAVPLALLGLVTPLVAALAMSGSSLLVVGNALRLRSAAR